VAHFQAHRSLMSVLASDTQNKVVACRSALLAVENHLEPLLALNSAEVKRKLPPLETAELHVSVAYTVASLYFCHLLTQGTDPGDHPIRQELDRIQKYFKKVRAKSDDLEAQEQSKNRVRVNTEAAKRIVKHYASAAEATAQRWNQAIATKGTDGPLPRPTADQTQVQQGERTSRKRRRQLAKSAATMVGAACEAAAASTAPAAPKQPSTKHDLVGEETPKAAAVPKPELTPMEPNEAEAKAAAEAIVAKGQADAERSANRKKRRKKAAKTVEAKANVEARCVDDEIEVLD